MFLRLFLLFVFVPLADLLLLLAMSRFVGFWFTVVLILLSALMGAYFAKRSGGTVWRQMREKISRNELPTDSLADGAIVLFAGGLLLTPGLITDIVGMSMLIPATRKFYKTRLVNWFKRRFQITSASGFPPHADILDGEVVQKNESATEEPRKVDPEKIELLSDD